MVPNISNNGRSFRGAGAYHLHDKRDAANARPRTSDRVAFTAARNLANADPRAALDEMWRTAEDARHLKEHAGLAPSGRKNDAPVKTVSLAWAPGQAPTREEMFRAADGFLKAMGWGEHQTLYVAHNDTRHAHLHLIINRVHPDTGRTLNDWQERKRAQKWALGYETEQGNILCPARAARHDRAGKPPPSSMPYRQAKLLSHHDPAQRKRIARHVRAAFRPAWAAHYRRQRAALATFDRHARDVERTAAALVRQGDSLRALKVLDALGDRRTQLIQSFRRRRATLARSQNAALRDLLAVDRHRSTATPTENRHGDHQGEENSAPWKHAVSLRRIAPLPARSLRLAPGSFPPPRPSLVRPSRVERHPRLALRAAARELLRPLRSAPRQVAFRARAEIAVQFAHRWAAIRRMPPEERAAAAAALRSEQEAALAARTKHLLGELHQEHRTEQARHRARLAARRGARLSWRRRAWISAANTVAARRAAHMPSRPASLPRAKPPPMNTRLLQ